MQGNDSECNWMIVVMVAVGMLLGAVSLAKTAGVIGALSGITG